MKVWIFWRENCAHGADGIEEFENRQAAQAWLDKHPHWVIDKVIEGRELHAKLVEVVKRYEIVEAK